MTVPFQHVVTVAEINRAVVDAQLIEFEAVGAGAAANRSCIVGTEGDQVVAVIKLNDFRVEAVKNDLIQDLVEVVDIAVNNGDLVAAVAEGEGEGRGEVTAVVDEDDSFEFDIFEGELFNRVAEASEASMGDLTDGEEQFGIAAIAIAGAELGRAEGQRSAFADGEIIVAKCRGEGIGIRIAAAEADAG